MKFLKDLLKAPNHQQMKQSSAQLVRQGSHVFLHLFRIFQFDAQQAKPEIKGSYVSATQTSLPEWAGVFQHNQEREWHRPPQTIVHVCLSVSVRASLGCLHVRADVMPLTCLTCQERNLAQNLLFGNSHNFFSKGVAFNWHILKIVSAFIIDGVKPHIWAGLVC